VEVHQPANLVVLVTNGVDYYVKPVPHQDVPHALLLSTCAQRVKLGTIYQDLVIL
jgi:hypothetical protein